MNVIVDIQLILFIVNDKFNTSPKVLSLNMAGITSAI